MCRIQLKPDYSLALPVPFPRSYWVIPGLLIAGEYPGTKDSKATRQKIGKLLDTGVRLFINLMEPREVDFFGSQISHYEDILAELAHERHIDARMQRFPIVDMRVPGPGLMRQILDTIDKALDERLPVYVHCLGGIGRTGTVVGCFLIRHGLASPDTVLDRIARLRAKDPKADRPAPEAPIQREFIRHWAQKDRDAASNS